LPSDGLIRLIVYDAIRGYELRYGFNEAQS
jgi:hypothetical protein